MTFKQRIVLILFLSVAAGLFLAFILPRAASTGGGDEKMLAVTDDVFGGAFTLQDHDGKTVTDKDYAGQYRLMYFGFTFCPAICPTELQKITVALSKMGGDAKAVHPLFVTVDPERDTPAKMKAYLESFDPSITGLTGTAAQTAAMLKAYKIYAAKVQDPALSDYTVDHSTFVYFLAPDGRLLHIFKLADTADEMAATMAAWIRQDKASG